MLINGCLNDLQLLYRKKIFRRRNKRFPPHLEVHNWTSGWVIYSPYINNNESINMKEDYYYWKKIITNFYYDIFRNTLILFFIGSVIILIINTWRFNPLAYIICFFISFAIGIFNYMRKDEIKNEFKRNQ